MLEEYFENDGSPKKQEIFLFCNSLNAVAPCLRLATEDGLYISERYALTVAEYLRTAQEVITMLLRIVEDLGEA